MAKRIISQVELNCNSWTVRKTFPRKIAPRKLSPKIWLTSFLLLLKLFDICSSCFFFKIFIVNSFRGISRTPVTSRIDLLMKTQKRLHFRCCGGHKFTSGLIRWTFSKMFITKARRSASETHRESYEVCIMQNILLVKI